MKSKTSCFNKTIFKKNMTHFWPLWALYSCYLIVSLPVGLWFNMRYYLQDDSYSQLQRQFYAISGAMRAAMNPVITFCICSSDDHGSVFLSVFCKEYEYDPFTSGGQTGVVCNEYHICVCIYDRSADPDLYYHGVRLHWRTYHQHPVHFILVWCRSRNDVFCAGTRRICGDVYRTASGISGVLCRSQLSVCRMLVSDQHGDRECLLWGVKQLESGKILYFVSNLLSDKQSADTVSRKQ